MRVIPAATPGAAPRTVARRRKGHEYFVDHHGADFWIRTNDRGPNFRLVRAPVADPGPARWRQVLAHRKGRTPEAVGQYAGERQQTEAAGQQGQQCCLPGKGRGGDGGGHEKHQQWQ